MFRTPDEDIEQLISQFDPYHEVKDNYDTMKLLGEVE